MPKYCMSCGAELPEGTQFCTGCGTKVEQTPQQPMPIQALKKSKTKLIAIIAIIVVAIIVVAVLFLVVLGNDTSKFTGTWTVEYLVGSTNPNLEWTFNQNGTLKSEQPGYNPIWSSYELSGGRVCFKSNEYTYYHCYDYEFSDNGNKLTLSARGIDSIILSRKG